MAVVFTPQASHYNTTVFGNVRAVYGQVTCDTAVCSCTLGLSTIYHAQVCGASAAPCYFEKIVVSATTLSIGSASTGDVFNVFALGL